MQQPYRLDIRRCAVIVGLLLAGGRDAESQRLVINAFQPFATPPRTMVHSLTTGQEEFAELGGIGSRRTVFTADGRFALWQRQVVSGTPPLVLYDVVRRTVVPLPFDMEPLAAHPRDLAVFGRSQAAAVRLDLGGQRVLYDCAPSSLVMLDLSADGKRLAAVCDSGVVGVVDAATGGVLYALNGGPPASVPSAHFDVLGTRLLIARRLPPLRTQFALVDLASGQDVATAESPDVPQSFQGGGCTVDVVSAQRSAAIVACSWFFDPGIGPFTQSFKTRRLDLAGLTWGPLLDVRYLGASMSLDPAATRLIAASISARGFAAIQVLDAVSGASLIEVPMFGGGLGVAYAPLAPTLSAAVTGRSVRLDWSLPAHSPPAADYAIEIGSGPGLSDLGRMTVPVATISAAAVPPGRYYARVRAVNDTGTGAPSNEVIVDVP
jgi:hypothetical protein